MASEFIPDPDLDRELRRQAEMIAARMDAAEQVVRATKDVAPVNSGQYVDRLRAVTDGADVRAESYDPAAHLVEFGSINNPAYAPLRRGAQQVGDFVEDRK